MSSDLARNTAIKDIYALGRASTLSILQADFGYWPPKGLIPVQTPDIPIDFKTYFHPRGNHGIVTDNAPSTIRINSRLLLPHLFNRVSAGLGDTVSHENIHVLQNCIMHGQGLVPLRENYGDVLKSLASPQLAINTNIDEIQAHLHAIVSDHYRRTRIMPMNTADLWAMLRTERVAVKSPYVDDLLDNTMEGRWAKKRFPEQSARPRKDLLIDVSQLNIMFWFTRKDRIDEFCEHIIPAAYGRLLEIYGDQLGCIRMGDNHNLLLAETFARQARDLEGNHSVNTAAIEKTISMMPLSQMGRLQHELPRYGGWKHKRTANPVPLKLETIDFLCELLYRHTAPVIAKLA